MRNKPINLRGVPFVILFLMIGFFSFAQERLIRGKILDTEGNPLEGVSIKLKDIAGAGTLSAKDGTFQLQLNAAAKTLLISNVGYNAKQVHIGPSDNNISIRLESNTQDFEEVVVVGYGAMKKRDLTGAVASVNAKDLNTIPAGNPLEALQGKIAGVDIGAVTSPGSAPRIRIRGNRSLNASNEPLYVVDGIPRNSIDDIPVNDIESIEVLKDAASTAIYGSRGANGVVIVSTRRAKANTPTSVSYNTYVGMNKARFPKMMTGDEYVQFRRDVFRASHNNGWASGEPRNEDVFAAKELAIVNSGQFVDWQDLMYRKKSMNQEHNISIAHGSEKTQMVIFAGYRDEEGYYKTNDFKRYNLSVNLDHRISDALKIGLSSRLSNSDRNLFWAPDVNMLYMNPTATPYDEQGNMIWNPSVQQTAAWNILANYQEPYINNDNWVKSFNVIYAEYSFFDGFKLRSNFGLDLAQQKRREYYGSMTTLRYGRPDYARKAEEARTGILWDNILSYDKKFNKHSINGTFVVSYQRQKTNGFFASGEGFPGEELEDWNLNSATQNLLIGSDYEKWTLGSLLGRFQYGYNNKYLLNFSFRADGSSVLADGNKWGYFPAVSAAWVIDQEEFFESKTINALKLRASYGVVGNSAIAPYSTLANTMQATYNFGEKTYFGYKLGGLVNKQLGWEYSGTYNFGLDFGLLSNRLSGTFEFYKTATTDLLMKRSLPDFSGSESPGSNGIGSSPASVFQNIGSTSNTGFEAMITSNNIVSDKFRWSTTFNFYTNKEKIVSLLADEDMVGNKWFIGQPIGVYYDYDKLGIWQTEEKDVAAGFQRKPGDPKLRDVNSDGIIDADHDRVVLGQTSPKFGGFIRNSFGYKGFNLAIALEGKFGHMVESSMLGGNIFYDGTRWAPQALAGNYWTPDNPDGEYPYLNRAVEQRANLFGIRKAGYINVQEISLGYAIQEKLGPFKTLNVYARARNPFYLYKQDKDLDPQSPNFDYSAYRVFVLGLNINL